MLVAGASIIKPDSIIADLVILTRRKIFDMKTLLSGQSQDNQLVMDKVNKMKDNYCAYLKNYQTRMTDENLKTQIEKLSVIFQQGVQSLSTLPPDEMNQAVQTTKKGLKKLLLDGDVQKEIAKIKKEMTCLSKEMKVPPLFMDAKINGFTAPGKSIHQIKRGNWRAITNILVYAKEIIASIDDIESEHPDLKDSLIPTKTLFEEIEQLYTFDQELWFYTHKRFLRQKKIEFHLETATKKAEEHSIIDEVRRSYLKKLLHHTIIVHKTPIIRKSQPSLSTLRSFEKISGSDIITLDGFCKTYSDQIYIKCLCTMADSEVKKFFVNGVFFASLISSEEGTSAESFIQVFCNDLKKYNTHREHINRKTFEALYTLMNAEGARSVIPSSHLREVHPAGQFEALAKAYELGTWHPEEEKEICIQKLKQGELDQICETTMAISSLDGFKLAWEKLNKTRYLIGEEPPPARPAKSKITWWDNRSST